MSLSVLAVSALTWSSLAQAAQPIVVLPLEGEDPFPAPLQKEVEGILLRCLAEKVWVGSLDVRWGWYGDTPGPQVSAGELDTPKDCVRKGMSASEVLRPVEDGYGGTFQAGLDPAWLAAVTVEGGDAAFRTELKERFAACAAGKDLDVWYAAEVAVQKVPGYDDPVGSARGARPAPASPLADEVASCATATYLTSKGQKVGTSTALVTVHTGTAAPPAVALKSDTPLDPAAQKAIEHIVGGCARQVGWKGTVTYVLDVKPTSSFGGIMNSSVPPAMQTCLGDSAPVGIPEGQYNVEATVR